MTDQLTPERIAELRARVKRRQDGHVPSDVVRVNVAELDALLAAAEERDRLRSALREISSFVEECEQFGMVQEDFAKLMAKARRALDNGGS